MESVFIKSIRIDKIRHLENIDINICDSERRHVIVTGKMVVERQVYLMQLLYLLILLHWKIIHSRF